MSLSVRTATTADAALIADLSRQTFYDTFAAQNTAANMAKFMDEQFTRGRLMLEVGRRGSSFWLAYDGDEPAGYMKLREDHTHPLLRGTAALEVARFYACTPMIGKGVGRLLMQTAVDEASAKKKEWIWLCVWEHNQRAIDFYTRWGFERFGSTEFLLGDDIQCDWLMKRRV